MPDPRHNLALLIAALGVPLPTTAVVQITNEQLQLDSFTNQPFTVLTGVGSGVIYN